MENTFIAIDWTFVLNVALGVGIGASVVGTIKFVLLLILAAAQQR